MSRLAKTIAICVAAAVLLAVPPSAVAQDSTSPTATAARNCSVKNLWRKLGASYVNKLSTRNVSCADARSFSRLYHRCRRRNGGLDGRCPRINRFRCSERRYNKIDISYDSNVLCVRGSKRIRETYTQLT